MFGSVIEEGASQQNAISNATYFVRNQEKILDVVNNIEHDNPKIIPWLFCYKADEVPLYYIVINPYSVQCIEDIEATPVSLTYYSFSPMVGILSGFAFHAANACSPILPS